MKKKFFEIAFSGLFLLVLFSNGKLRQENKALEAELTKKLDASELALYSTTLKVVDSKTNLPVTNFAFGTFASYDPQGENLMILTPYDG